MMIKKTKLKIKFYILTCSWIFSHLLFATLGYALNLDAARVHFLQGKYQEVINDCENILARSDYSRDFDGLYYILGTSYLKQGNLLRACDVFEIIIKEFKESSFRDEALIGLGDVYFLKADYENAENKYQQVLNTQQNSKYKALLFYKLAQTSLKRGNWQQAESYIEGLNKDYAQSFEYRLAKNLSRQEFFFTVQVGAFSNEINARNLCAKLVEKGYAAYIEEPGAGEARTYRVRVGKLSSAAQAKEVEDKLISEGYPTRIFP